MGSIRNAAAGTVLLLGATVLVQPVQANAVVPLAAAAASLTATAAAPAALSAASVRTGQRSYRAARDTYANRKRPSSVHGSLPFMRTSRTGTRAYLAFWVRGIPRGAVVTSAVLTLHRAGTGPLRGLRAYRVQRAWHEGTLRYRNRPPVSGALIRSRVPGRSSVQLNLTRWVRGNGYLSLAVLVARSASSAWLRTREHAGTGDPGLSVRWRVRTPVAARPNVASVSQRSGESWAQACLRTMTYGFTGCVRYLPPGRKPAWDAQFRLLAARAGSRPLGIQLTVKTHDRAGLSDVLSHLPRAWKSRFIYNIHQEPEDDVTSASGQAAYRAAYTDAAKVTRRYGMRLPYVEWQEWTVDPSNGKGWDLRDFRPPARDFGGVLWSMFEYNERDRVPAQVARIRAAMHRYAPGKPWALMATAYTLEGQISASDHRHQAEWLRRAYNLTRAGGSSGFAWFNFRWPGHGGAAGEARVERNPGALAVLRVLRTG